MPTLTEKFIKTCLDFSDREAMRTRTPTGWVSFKYRDLLVNARKVAYWLKKQGFEKQQRVAIVLDNSPQWSMVYFGVLLAGGVSVPLDSQASRQDIVTFIEDSACDFAFLENRLLDLLQHHLRSVKKMIVLKKEATTQHCFSFDEMMASFSMIDTTTLETIDPEDTASILYSSGTTSNPKGVELSHKNLYSNCCGIEQLKVCSSSDIFISILPLFHAYAFMATLLYPIFIGARIVYPKTIKSAELVDILKDQGVTVIVGVPELFNNIHKSISEKMNALPLSVKTMLRIVTHLCWLLRKKTGINLSKLLYHSVHERFGTSLRYLISGGAKLDSKVGGDFEKFGFAILEGYGLTETAPIVTLNPPEKNKIGSVGKPISGVEVRIMNPDSSGSGEIAIRGPNVMKGYYQKPEETAVVIKDGWFYSGDLGYCDKEGYLYISGRLKEVIVLGSGKNIFPDEIEKYYSRSQYIKEVGVFLSQADRAESLKAIIVPDLELFRKNRQINIEEKIRWDMENISKELSSYKRVMGFAISKEELPKTRLGKIKRYQLSQIYLQESLRAKPAESQQKSKPQDPLLENPLGRRMAEFLKKELSLDRDIAASDHLELDLEVDSLTRVELIAGLEKLFHIRLPDDILREVATVTDLIGQVDRVLRMETSEDFKETSRASWRDILRLKGDTEEFEHPLSNEEGQNRFLDYLAKALFFLILKIFCRLKVFGQEHLPPKGPYIICCNHTSFLDAFVVITGLPQSIATETYFIGLKEIFDLPAIRWSTRLARVIPIDPATELVRAMKAASYVLRNNKILCIFPEGQRSIDGEVKRFKKGVGILAKELQVPVVPVAIDGAYEAWPRTVRFPRPHPIKIIFGKPIGYRDILKSSSGEDDYKRIADSVRERIVKLKEEIASVR